MTMSKRQVFAGLLMAVLATSSCVTSEKRPLPLAAASKTATQIDESQLLDIAIGLFDPNVPTSEKEQQSQRIDPAIRTAESRYMAVALADTLQGTGYWGQVRVVPRGLTLLDVNVNGVILVSNGSQLKLSIKAADATGRVWLTKEYAGEPDTRSYKDGATTRRDPFQNVYVRIADDLSAMRKKLQPADLKQIQRLAQLRFDSDVAPYAYADYVKQGRDGKYQVVRLPAEDAPLSVRLTQVREREYALMDTLDDQYRLSSGQVSSSYLGWRKSNHAEMDEERELRNSARTRMLLGAAAVIGGIAAAADSSSSTAGQIAGSVAVAGGIEAFKSGMGKRAEAKAHSESLKQQVESFSAEVTPANVEVEGRVVELRGSTEQQFLEWRRLLKDLYQNETGVAPVTPATAARP
jgi:hypothetical protein